MKLNRELPLNSVAGGLILALTILFAAPLCRANIYATNIRINGGFTNVVVTNVDFFTIDYLLNEDASLGATIQIKSGANVVRTMVIQPQTLGALRGVNAITWDGLNDSGKKVTNGTYSVSVTAASSGYTNWTQITSDVNDQNTYVFDGHGIAVDGNQNSPYYGRIFVANSSFGFSPVPGDSLGILKFNADTSDAEEGIASTDVDGHAWADSGVSPWKLEVGADDRVYVDDLANGGEIYSWDPTTSSNSVLYVLRQDNRPPTTALGGLALLNTGTAPQIWMSDTNSPTIRKWSLNATSVCNSNDLGTVVVSGAVTNFFDVALDKAGNIYTCAFIGASGDPSPRVLRYHAPSASLPATNIDWAVGGGDDTYAGASAVAVDPTGTYLAVAFQGPAGGASTNSNTKILSATDGSLVVNLDLGVGAAGNPAHIDTDCAWDPVGNVYYIDAWNLRWRAFSPPGTNQATTVAVPTIQVGVTQPGTPIRITGISVVGNSVSIDFSADPNDTPASFIIQETASLNGTYSPLANPVVTQVSPGLFHSTFTAGPTTEYFRIARQGTNPPPTGQLSFTKTAISGSNIILTFSGNANDPASAFTILSSATVNGTYAPNATANISLVSPGIFQASLPASGPNQFYKVRR